MSCSSCNAVLSIDDIQTMSMSDIIEAYGNGYKLDNVSNSIHGLDITAWLNDSTCVGTDPNQMCVQNTYIVASIGIVALVLLMR